MGMHAWAALKEGEAVPSATFGVRSRSDLRPKKNMRSSWQAWFMWWNCPAVHGVWKSEHAHSPWICHAMPYTRGMPYT